MPKSKHAPSPLKDPQSSDVVAAAPSKRVRIWELSKKSGSRRTKQIASR